MISTKRSIQPSVPYPYPLLKRFYLGFIYVVLGIVTALNMNAVFWKLSLLYIKGRLYSNLFHLAQSLLTGVLLLVLTWRGLVRTKASTALVTALLCLLVNIANLVLVQVGAGSTQTPPAVPI